MAGVVFSSRSNEALLLDDGRLVYIDLLALDDKLRWRLALEEDRPQQSDIDLSVLEALLLAGDQHRDWVIKQTIHGVEVAGASVSFAEMMLEHGEEIRERPLTAVDWEELVDQIESFDGAQRELAVQLVRSLVCQGVVALEQAESWLGQQSPGPEGGAALDS